MHGDKDAAADNLAKLDKICWLRCTEYDDLKQAIAESQKKPVFRVCILTGYPDDLRDRQGTRH